MKRVAILSFVLVMCLMMIACEDNSSVGVIGGADGPTSITVGKGDNKKNTKIEPIRMANIDGELYYEIDEDSEIEARCGVLDGNFENTVDRYEIPKNSGEVNFLGAEGYQLGMIANTIEVPLGDDWEIFKKIDTNRDVLKYKYCYVVEGILPNAKDDSDFMVLADTLDITFEEASYQIFGSNSDQMKDIYVLPIVD